MDKPHPLSCSTRKENLLGRLNMLSSHTLHRLVSCMLLLLLTYSRTGLSHRPHEAHVAYKGTSDADIQRAQLLKAVTMGILSSLGMDEKPRPTQKASEEELRKMYQLYTEKLREMRGNSSQVMSETRRYTMSTVLFPVTGETTERNLGLIVTFKCLMWKANLLSLSGSRKECFKTSSKKSCTVSLHLRTKAIVSAWLYFK